MRLLIQTQLSNYTKDGKFILECDSGWQMCISRARELLKLIPELHIDITGPRIWQTVTSPYDTPLLSDPRVRYIASYVPPNAVLSRHHFDVQAYESLTEYDAAYINDPMQLRNFKALLNKRCKLYAVHNHFIDNPSCPKFPVETSLWLGQCEAVRRADVNFFQCESAMAAFRADYGHCFEGEPWDDGYSVEEITSPVNFANVRFDMLPKRIVFVPNRVGREGVSSDYTNCGKFLTEILPQIRRHDTEFSVVAGNPGQKVSNEQLHRECGTLNLVSGSLTRDEYKLIAKNSCIAVALYNKDTYGGTAIRECIELGCLPLWLDCNEYRSLSHEAGYPYLCKMDFSDVADTTLKLLSLPATERQHLLGKLQEVVRRRCSIEATTPLAAKRMGLL